MAAINFPDSPSLNDTYTVGDKTWLWDGSYWRILSLPSSINTIIKDTDNDTKVQVEEGSDDDTIRFDTAGTERMTITSAGHLIPSANVTYDLGSATNRFRDLYLSGTTIDLGGVTISSDGTTVTIPDLAVTTDIEAATVSASTSMTINSVTMTSDGTTVTIPALAVTAGIDADTLGGSSSSDFVSVTNGSVTTASTSSNVVRNITLSTSLPTGGSDGDVWMTYS